VSTTRIILDAAGGAGSCRRHGMAVLAGTLRLHSMARGVDPARISAGVPGRLAQLISTPAAANRAERLRTALERRQIASDEFVGRVYLAVSHDDEARARLGLTYTPPEVVDAVLDVLDEPALSGTAAPTGAFRVLDPACGCGAFVLRAFDRLHGALVRGSSMAPARAALECVERHIHGADIDPGAVEVTRVLLAVRALAAGCRTVPAMNIDERDFLEAPPERNVAGGFDVVLGNPPFVEGRRLAPEMSRRLKRDFRASRGKVNLAACFVERAIEKLSPGGRLGFVLPGAMLRNERYWAVRELMLSRRLDRAVAVHEMLFGGRTVDASLVTLTRVAPARLHRTGVALAESVSTLGGLRYRKVPQALFRRAEGQRVNVLLSAPSLKLLARIRDAGMPMERLFETRDGISTGFRPFPDRLLGLRRGEYFISRDGERAPFTARLHKPVIDGSEISAYRGVRWEGRYIRYDKRIEKTPEPPAGRRFNCQLRDAAIFDRPVKLLTRQTADRLVATVDADRFYCRNSIHVTYPLPEREGEVSVEALMMLLNSRLMNYYYRMTTQEIGRAFPQVHVSSLRTLPVAGELVENCCELAVLGRLALADGIEEPELSGVIERAERIIRHAYRLSSADVRRIERYASAVMPACTRAAG